MIRIHLGAIVDLVGMTTIDRNGIEEAINKHYRLPEESMYRLPPIRSVYPADILAEVAGRLCYMSFLGPRRKENDVYLEHIIDAEHFSVLEHNCFSFILQGVSRTLTHELVRHRHFGYSQLSQRFVDESEPSIVVPPKRYSRMRKTLLYLVSIKEKLPSPYSEMLTLAFNGITCKSETYKGIVDDLEYPEFGANQHLTAEFTEASPSQLVEVLTFCANAILAGFHKAPEKDADDIIRMLRWIESRILPFIAYAEDVEKETAVSMEAYKSKNGGRELTLMERTEMRKAVRSEARSGLPNCTETKIMVSGNLRSYREFFTKRTHKNAEAEIRNLAIKMFWALQKVAPNSLQKVQIDFS